MNNNEESEARLDTRPDFTKNVYKINPDIKAVIIHALNYYTLLPIADASKISVQQAIINLNTPVYLSKDLSIKQEENVQNTTSEDNQNKILLINRLLEKTLSNNISSEELINLKNTIKQIMEG